MATRAKKKTSPPTRRMPLTLVPIENVKDRQKLVQAFLDRQLVDATRRIAKEHGMTMREVVQWGCREFVAHVDPQAAEAMGIPLRRRRRAAG